MEPLKVGLMGLGRGGRALADVLLGSSWCKLVAVASIHSKRIEQFRNEHPGIAMHDDFRSLIVSSPLDALFVAVPPFLRGSYLSLAAERHMPVFMLTPAARRFDEALALVEAFEEADCPIAVSQCWDVEPGLHVDALGIEQAGKFFLARGSVTANLDDDFDWRGDSRRAGGGVLLYQAYGLLDVLVQVMGLPSTVYAVASNISRPGTRFQYDTEDTAVLTCRYPSGALATISACWTTGPADWSIELFGTGGSLRVDTQFALMRDRTGQQETSRLARSADPLAVQVNEFLSTICSSPRSLRGTLREHLPVVATIESAYLSARTGQPESPGTIFKIHDVKEPAPPRLVL